MNPIEWLFTPLFNSNFTNCFGNQPCYQEPFGLLPPPIWFVGIIFVVIGWKKGWFKTSQSQEKEVHGK